MVTNATYNGKAKWMARTSQRTQPRVMRYKGIASDAATPTSRRGNAIPQKGVAGSMASEPIELRPKPTSHKTTTPITESTNPCLAMNRTVNSRSSRLAVRHHFVTENETDEHTWDRHTHVPWLQRRIVVQAPVSFR